MQKPAIYLSLVLLTVLGGGVFVPVLPAAHAESIVIGRHTQTQITGKVTRVARDYFIMESGNKRFDVHIDGLKGDTPVNMVVQKGATVTVGGEFSGERFGRAQFDAANVTAITMDPYLNPADIAPAAGGEGAVQAAPPQKTRRVISSPKGSFKMIVDE